MWRRGVVRVWGWQQWGGWLGATLSIARLPRRAINSPIYLKLVRQDTAWALQIGVFRRSIVDGSLYLLPQYAVLQDGATILGVWGWRQTVRGE